jgi:hypothetical protein
MKVTGLNYTQIYGFLKHNSERYSRTTYYRLEICGGHWRLIDKELYPADIMRAFHRVRNAANLYLDIEWFA